MTVQVRWRRFTRESRFAGRVLCASCQVSQARALHHNRNAMSFELALFKLDIFVSVMWCKRPDLQEDAVAFVALASTTTVL